MWNLHGRQYRKMHRNTVATICAEKSFIQHVFESTPISDVRMFTRTISAPSHLRAMVSNYGRQ